MPACAILLVDENERASTSPSNIIVDVLATTFAADATIQAAVRAGIRRVLPKPVDFGHLIPLIDKVARIL